MSGGACTAGFSLLEVSFLRRERASTGAEAPAIRNGFAALKGRSSTLCRERITRPLRLSGQALKGRTSRVLPARLAGTPAGQPPGRRRYFITAAFISRFMYRVGSAVSFTFR